MKKGFLLAVLSSQLLTCGQENWGKINFKTLSIPTADGSGTYAVPIRDCSGAGLPNATVGLFLPDPSSPDRVSSTPFAFGRTGTTANLSPYVIFPSPSQTVTVPGHPPGSRAVVIIRFWSGSQYGPSVSPSGQWLLTTLPLGGAPAGGGSEIPTPSLTGWGPEDSSGLTVDMWQPTLFIKGSAEASVYAAPATVSLTVSYGTDPGYIATSLAVYAGVTLVTDQVPSPIGPRMYVTPPLGPGTYLLYSILRGGYGNCITENHSAPINITVVDPVDISLTPPTTANGQLTFQYTVNPGLSYSVETSTNLKDWQTTDTTKPTTSPAQFTQPLNSATPTFYRVQRLPNP